MKDETLRAKDQETLALYLHVPFCRRRCNYCDFNTYAGLEALFAPYVAALAQEIRQTGQGERAATLFFGGGTPSVLPLALVADLVAACHDAFAIDVDAEISLEANPGMLNQADLDALRRLGINRLSLGLQSSHPDELALLGRLHTFEQARQVVSMARAAGFDNLSLDLIYGLPQQSLEAWAITLQSTLTLAPDHLSAYCLTIEQDTPLAAWVASGRVPAPDPDLAADMYELAESVLERAGLRHYEISNWARPGQECRHNLVYWRNGAYLGLGAGAHSYRHGQRWWNVLAPDAYIARLQAGQSSQAGVEEIDPALAMGETMMLGLRLHEGVSARAFRDRFSRELAQVYGQTLDELTAAGLVEWDGRRVRLTARGRLLGNQVFARFLP